MGSGVRFFNMSFADINREPTLTFSNNDAENEFVINRDPIFLYESTGSSDSVTETFEFDFGVSRTIDTLIMTGNNLKDFSLDYWDGAAWQQILAETANADAVYHNQFSSQATEKVRLNATKTFVVDDQKQIQDFIITKEIGQLVGYPEPTFRDDSKPQKKRMITAKEKLVYAGDHAIIQLRFKDHMGNADRTLFTTLVELRQEFLVWLSGGNADQFVHTDRGYRLKDIFLVGLDPRYAHKYTKNLYFSGMNVTIPLIEVA